MRKLRVLVLMHEDLVPPDSIEGLVGFDSGIVMRFVSRFRG
jgi:hypothetical protein